MLRSGVASDTQLGRATCAPDRRIIQRGKSKMSVNDHSCQLVRANIPAWSRESSIEFSISQRGAGVEASDRNDN